MAAHKSILDILSDLPVTVINTMVAHMDCSRSMYYVQYVWLSTTSCAGQQNGKTGSNELAMICEQRVVKLFRHFTSSFGHPSLLVSSFFYSPSH